MPRAQRITYAGAMYHVYTRGNEKKDIFRDDIDFRKFLKIIRILNIKYQYILHGYCLMPNHLHLIIETPLPNLSEAMHDLLGEYAQYFNHKYDRVGHLYQGRFGSKVIQADDYFLQVSRYVHRNPLEAGFVTNVINYPWSSYRYFCTQQKDQPSWLNVTRTLDLSSLNAGVKGAPFDPRRSYRQWTESIQPRDEKFETKKRGQARSSVTFSDHNANMLVQVETALTSIDRESKIRQRLFVYLLRKYTSLTWTEIALKIDQSTVNGLRKRHQRFKETLNEGDSLNPILIQIEKRIQQNEKCHT